jgi:hypothetical protein
MDEKLAIFGQTPASNDELIPQLHRANPIPETVQSISGFPATLKLYRIPASKFWQVRAFMGGKIIKKSTKTEDKADAIKAAKDFYNTLLLKRAQNLPLTESPTFERVSLDLLREDKARVERKEVSKRLVRDEQYIFDADIVPFFRHDHVKDINYARIVAYVEHLKHRGKKPVSSNTIKIHFVYLRKVLKHAWKLGLLDRLPIFPKIKVKDNPREWFTKEQYDLLKKTIAEEIKKGTVVRYHKITDELRFLTTFMVNSWLRPSDIKNLQNKHIEVVKQKGGTQFLRIRPPSSKTVNTPVVTMAAAVGIYEDITEYNKKLGFGNPDDFVFFPHLKNREFAMQTMRRQFDHCLTIANLKHSAGVPRTLYSLRHTAAMLTLTLGDSVDLLTLARNMRSSVSMLERFYVSHLSAEMNIEKLQSRKRRQQQ